MNDQRMHFFFTHTIIKAETQCHITYALMRGFCVAEIWGELKNLHSFYPELKALIMFDSYSLFLNSP